MNHIVPQTAALPRGIVGRLTATQWIPPDNLDLEGWLHQVGLFKLMHGAVQFWLGDALRFGEERFGELHTQALEEHSYQTLANVMWVSKAIPGSRRREAEVLSWSHHAEVAALEPEQQESWLERAQGEGMSVRQLRAGIRASQGKPHRDLVAELREERETLMRLVRALVTALEARGGLTGPERGLLDDAREALLRE